MCPELLLKGGEEGFISRLNLAIGLLVSRKKVLHLDPELCAPFLVVRTVELYPVV